MNPQETDNPKNQSSETLLERLSERIAEISSLPELALEIMQLAENPETGADDLLEAIRRDPALAMRLMRTVNSSYYALRERVADLKQAITLLGFTEVRNLSLTSYVAQLFQETEGHGVYNRRDLWNHMVGVGMVSRMVAKTCGKVAQHEAYLAGLLHDLGLVLIDQYLHGPFCRVVDALTEEASVCEVEMGILGFDHAALGAFLAEKWNLPGHLTTAIRHHHKPEQYEGSDPEMVCAVAIANSLCHLKGLPSLGIPDRQMPQAELFAKLGLQKEQISWLVAQLDETLAAADVMAVVQVR